MKKKLFRVASTIICGIALMITICSVIGIKEIGFKGNRYLDYNCTEYIGDSQGIAFAELYKLKRKAEHFSNTEISNIFYDELISRNRVKNGAGAIWLDHGYCLDYIEEMRAKGQIPADYQLPTKYESIFDAGNRKTAIAYGNSYVLQYRRNQQTAPTTTPTSDDFDPIYYAEHNPDVVTALGTDPAVLKQHYEMFGKIEGRKAHK